MNSIHSKSNEVLFDHKALKLFLYCKEQEEDISIRQAQRELGLASSSVHWHLNKLIKAGLVEQDEDQLYRISPQGKSLSFLSLPVLEPYFILNDKLLPMTLFRISFLVSSTIIAFILVFNYPNSSLLLLFSVVIIEMILQIRSYIQIRNPSN